MHDSERRNDIYYVCCMIEFTSRKTKNHRSAVARKLGIKGIQQELSDAAVSHCLSFEEVSEDWTLRYGIAEGILTRSAPAGTRSLPLPQSDGCT